MSEPITPEWEHLRRRAFNMSCDDQLTLAQAIAANLGYHLTPESGWDENPNTLEARVTALERIVGKRM